MSYRDILNIHVREYMNREFAMFYVQMKEKKKKDDPHSGKMATGHIFYRRYCRLCHRVIWNYRSHSPIFQPRYDKPFHPIGDNQNKCFLLDSGEPIFLLSGQEGEWQAIIWENVYQKKLYEDFSFIALKRAIDRISYFSQLRDHVRILINPYSRNWLLGIDSITIIFKDAL